MKFHIRVAALWIEAEESGRAEDHLNRVVKLGKQVSRAENLRDITFFEELPEDDHIQF